MYEGPLLDIDVHHQAASDAELIPYAPLRTRELVTRMVEVGIPLDMRRGVPVIPDGGSRLDAGGPNGAPPGSNLDVLREQCLDRYGTDRCLLTHNVGEFGSHLNPYVSTDLCTAANDWNIDRWLGEDDRLYSGIIVSGLLPDEAANEVRRLADHPRMSCVMISGSPLARPLGDPLYHPIYAAAAEVGLPVVTHIGIAMLAPARSVAGPSSTASEMSTHLMVAASNHLSSFIVHGVFEKYPSLRLVLTEYGLSWLPPVLWNLDRELPSLRLESPWVKRAPSEYVHDHVKLSTQPLEATGNGRSLIEMLSAIDGIEDLLCFSSDYPHYTMDDFAFASRVIPDAWHSKVFYENARDVFDWDITSRREGAGTLSAR